MKTFKGFLYGVAIAIAVSAGAATVYNYFPPPGMTYTPTTGLVVGTATGGAQGTGTVNAQGVFVNGTAVSSSAAPGSNTQVVYNSSGAYAASSLLTFTPGSVLLNIGAATTPGTFSVGQLDSMVINGVTIPIPGFALNSNIQGVFENHSYVNGVASGGARYYGVRSEGTISSPAIVVNGDHLSTFYAAGYNGSSYSLGGDILFQVNGTPGASAMPTDLLFQLSPAASQVPATVLQLYHDGGAVFGAPTGGDQGVGTINMQGCFVNGVACSTGGTSGGNPTGTVGLTAVNGVAGTYMRSDAAPPLSQAIAPTWTGAHTFSQAQGATRFTLSGPNTGVGWNAVFTDTTNSVSRGFIGIGTNTVGGAAVTDFAVSPGASGSVVIGTANGGAIGTRFGPNGNVTINAPSSGVAESVTGIASQYAGLFTAGGTAGTQKGLSAVTATQNATDRVLNANNSLSNLLDIFGDGHGTLGPNLVWSTAGNWTLNASTSGNTLAVTGLANSYTQVITGSSTSGQSFGLLLDAGTTSADQPLLIRNQANSVNYFQILGDGGVVAGSPTGGDKGLGTVNMTGCFVNGVPCLTGSSGGFTKFAAGLMTTSGGNTCTINTNGGGLSSCTEAAAGRPVVNFVTSYFPTAFYCNASAVSANLSQVINTNGINLNSIQVYISQSGSNVDGSFNITCFGN